MSVSKRKEFKVRFRRRLGLCSQLLRYISLAFFFSLQNASFSQEFRSTRPNCFILQSFQAGSTTDIDNLIITDLDLGQVVYSNTFSTSSSATDNLNLFYWPQGGQSTTNFVLNGPMTRVVSGKLRLETTGFNANGNGGYESHSEAEWASTLPRNFLVEFEATRLQWAGHFHFHLFRKEPSDALGSHMIGGAMSATRSLTNRQDVPRMAASGSWFKGYGLITNWNGTQGWAVSFPAPGGNLQNNHRLGMSISNTTLSFYLNGNLLSSTNIPDFEDHNSGSSPVITSTNSFSGTVGGAFSATVTASGTAPITFAATNIPTGLNISTNGLISGTPSSAGTNSVVLVASNSFGTVSQNVSLVVSRGNQSIIFGTLPIKYVGDAAFNLTATASSGLTVTYTSSNTNVATVLGSLVTIMG